MITGQLFPTHIYGLAGVPGRRVSLTWTDEPTIDDVDALLEYLTLYRKIVEKRTVRQAASSEGGLR